MYDPLPDFRMCANSLLAIAVERQSASLLGVAVAGDTIPVQELLGRFRVQVKRGFAWRRQ
jgi:hypothetical protein